MKEASELLARMSLMKPKAYKCLCELNHNKGLIGLRGGLSTYLMSFYEEAKPVKDKFRSAQESKLRSAPLIAKGVWIGMPSSRGKVFNKILVAVDGSKCSDYALEKALALAKLLQAKLTVVHVVPKMPPYGTEVAAADTPYREFLIDQGRKVLNYALARVSELEVKAEGRLLEGSPAEEVIRLAEEECYDLVVVGSRGAGVTRAELGSVSERVVRYSPAPVLVNKCPREECKQPQAI